MVTFEKAYGYFHTYYRMLSSEASDVVSHCIKFLAFLRILIGGVEVDRLILYAIRKTKMQNCKVHLLLMPLFRFQFDGQTRTDIS